MTFLSPAFLFALAAAGFPVWLHLARRRKHVPVPFSSLRFLKQAAARARRQAKIEDLGLLVLRALLLALLALALARPVISSRRAFPGPGWPHEAVLVVDATASMQWKGPEGTRLDMAKRQAKEWIARLPSADRVALWVLSGQMEKPVPEPVADRQAVLDAIDAIRPGDGSASLAGVFAATRDWVVADPHGTRSLVIFTDNQPAAWDWPSREYFARSWPHGEVEVTVVQTDVLRPGNTAIRPIEWSAPRARAGRVLAGLATVVNHSETPVTELIEARAGEAPATRQTVEIPADGAVDVPVRLAVPADAAALIAGEVALAGDAMPADDRWFFVHPVQGVVRALVVEKSSGPTARVQPAFFLAKALAAGGGVQVETMGAGAWNTHPLEKTDAVFACGGAWTDDAAWQKATAFAETGGTVVAFADGAGDLPPQAWPVEGGREMPLPPGRVATRVLEAGHPLFAGLWDARTPFPPLSQGTARETTAKPGTRVLATVACEWPLVVERAIGSGRMVWLNTSADRAWGDFPLSPVYVALMQQLARLGELANRAPGQLWVGDGWPILQHAALWHPASTPAGQAVGRPENAGLYRADAGGVAGVWQCAVNTRRDESDLRPVPADTLKETVPGTVLAGTSGMRGWLEQSERQHPLWPWALAAAALVFTAECWWSAMAARRRMAAAAGAPQSTPKPRHIAMA
jgi:hypothetical protein